LSSTLPLTATQLQEDTSRKVHAFPSLLVAFLKNCDFPLFLIPLPETEGFSFGRCWERYSLSDNTVGLALFLIGTAAGFYPFGPILSSPLPGVGVTSILMRGLQKRGKRKSAPLIDARLIRSQGALFSCLCSLDRVNSYARHSPLLHRNPTPSDLPTHPLGKCVFFSKF